MHFLMVKLIIKIMKSFHDLKTAHYLRVTDFPAEVSWASVHMLYPHDLLPFQETGHLVEALHVYQQSPRHHQAPVSLRRACTFMTHILLFF